MDAELLCHLSLTATELRQPFVDYSTSQLNNYLNYSASQLTYAHNAQQQYHNFENCLYCSVRNASRWQIKI